MLVITIHVILSNNVISVIIPVYIQRI